MDPVVTARGKVEENFKGVVRCTGRTAHGDDVAKRRKRSRRQRFCSDFRLRMTCHIEIRDQLINSERMRSLDGSKRVSIHRSIDRAVSVISLADCATPAPLKRGGTDFRGSIRIRGRRLWIMEG
ncbi:hypothetical protein RB195_007929 [Necator americanus]|uniref:Uncharacterized protein n=1 Tax=Necator americanus TaxID=51031 RepID=A0ABR1BZL1_NECAM